MRPAEDRTADLGTQVDGLLNPLQIRGILVAEVMAMTMLSQKTLSDPPAMRLAIEHPELDEPEGDVGWERWLEGRQRLEMALLLAS